MNLSPRDRRALTLLAGALVCFGIYSFWPSGDAEVVEADPASVTVLERRLHRLRQSLATVPAREASLAAVDKHLAERAKGVIDAPTAAQAQALILQVVRKLARNQSPPVDIGQIDLGIVQPFGEDYGEALVSFSMTCSIDQLLNFLADISSLPEAVATHELMIRALDEKKKTLSVRVTVSGLLPRSLVPKRQGVPSF